ncbi:GGDEF domain-containing protein [Alteromonas sp. V450]|uniref:GGDEF domain-containing protein n=1 Tax=Alteromonas sp. V450 TaxID=1912139 RepID=UPI0008FF4E48|nr:diguanylate cyclase [Alteromonas sp. V450]OJF70158.1 GGDEF domain-containing protein [Alteromonas sp. V450]
MFVERFLHFFFCTFLFIAATESVASDDIAVVIENARAPTYDCPDPANYQALESALSSELLSQTQLFDLTVAKTHYMICSGKFQEAQELLLKTITQTEVDEDSYAFASAIYQIGFTYDVQESPARCKYYEQAQSLSSPSHYGDIYTSASMALINYCSGTTDAGERLGKMFAFVERYSKDGQPAELAHIHNNIGLLYGGIEQHALAAEQFLKAHEMGLKVYKGSNRTAILISAIVSLLSSGQHDEAYKRLLEFGRLNSELSTPLTEFHYQYALSIYYRKTRDYVNLNYTLPDLVKTSDAVSSSFGKLLVDWHEAEICLQSGDLACIKAYLSKMRDLNDTAIPANFRSNLDYLSFNVNMHIALGDLNKIKESHELYAEEVERRRIETQDSARIVSTAMFHSRINDLENQIQSAENRRRNTLVASISVFVLLSLVASFALRKKHLASKSVDPVTQLLNAETVINRINRLESPEPGRAIAIAIFDISNFRDVTRKLGSSKGNNVLRQLAETLQNLTRGNDILGRYGTEQFILCLHNIEERSARQFFERAQQALDNTFDRASEVDPIIIKSTMSLFITSEKISGLSDILDEMTMSIDIDCRHA